MKSKTCLNELSKLHLTGTIYFKSSQLRVGNYKKTTIYDKQ